MQQWGVKRAGRAFFSTDPTTLARELIGATLHRRLEDGGVASGVIVETEAYLGALDRCCHSFGNRRTAKNNSMFLLPGTAYLYFTYGMHHCFNVVCGTIADPEEPVAVLVRALLPASGTDGMFERRGPGAKRLHDLCSGPGKLCRALSLDLSLDGQDMTKSLDLWITPGRERKTRLVRSSRIGVSGGKGSGTAKSEREKWVGARLRWYDPDAAAWVSVRAKPEQIERWKPRE